MHRRTFLAATTAATAAQVLPLIAFAQGAANPLLAPWSGPFGGTPPFDKVRVEQFKPALEAAMAEESVGRMCTMTRSSSGWWYG